MGKQQVTHPIKFNANKRKFEQLPVQLLKLDLIWFPCMVFMTIEKRFALDKKG